MMFGLAKPTRPIQHPPVMKMTQKFLRPLVAFVAALAASHAPADTIILKNGTKFEGRIVKEDPDSYLLEIQVTRSIRDERRIAKADIEKIEKVDPSEALFTNELAKLGNTPDLLDEAGYQARIRKLEDFLKEYPASKHNRAARELLAKLEAERSLVAAGSIKLNGRMISPSERQADAVGIDAAILAAKMQRAAEAANFLEALRAFETLEKDAPGSKAHLEAIPLAGRLLTNFRSQINASLASLDQRLAERKVGLERMPAPDRARAQAIFDQQAKEFQARLTAEKAAGIKWLSIDYSDKASLSDTLRRIDTESNRLERTDTSRLGPSDQLYRDAWKQLETADPKEAKSLLDSVKRLKLPDRYISALEQRAAAAAPPPPAE